MPRLNNEVMDVICAVMRDEKDLNDELIRRNVNLDSFRRERGNIMHVGLDVLGCEYLFNEEYDSSERHRMPVDVQMRGLEECVKAHLTASGLSEYTQWRLESFLAHSYDGDTYLRVKIYATKPESDKQVLAVLRREIRTYYRKYYKKQFVEDAPIGIQLRREKSAAKRLRRKLMLGEGNGKKKKKG